MCGHNPRCHVAFHNWTDNVNRQATGTVPNIVEQRPAQQRHSRCSHTAEDIYCRDIRSERHFPLFPSVMVDNSSAHNRHQHITDSGAQKHPKDEQNGTAFS